LVISQTKSISFVYYDMVCSNWFPQLENFRDHMLLIFAKFIETEICSRDDYIYPPQHLIFNALNTKVVKTGPVRPVQPGIRPMAGLSS
jgi:uracil DNA glycosylase